MNYDQPPDPMIIDPTIMCPYPMTFGQMMNKICVSEHGVKQYTKAYSYNIDLIQIKYAFLPQKIYNN